MRRERDSRDALDNWHQDAICVELEITDKVQIRQTRVECSWCGKRHFVAVRNGQLVSGTHICGSCGQFFKFVVLDEGSTTKRVLAHQRFRVNPDPDPGEEQWQESLRWPPPPSNRSQRLQ